MNSSVYQCFDKHPNHSIADLASLQSPQKNFPKRSLSKNSLKDQDLLRTQPKKKVLTEKDECIDDTTNAYSRNWKEKLNDFEMKSNRSFNLVKENRFIQNYVRKPKCIQSFKSLLPNFLLMKISQHHEYLISIHRFIDKYLSKSPTLDKKDFFTNIKKSIYDSTQNQLKEKHLRQILYLCKDFYILNKDEHQNLIVGLPYHQNLDIRTQTIRKQIISFVYHSQNQNQNIDNIKETFSDVQIPEAELKCIQIKDFKTIKSPKKPKKNIKKQKNQIKPQFVKTIVDYIKQKELKSSSIKIEFEGDQKYKEIKETSLELLSSIEQIYTERKVRNIFKVNLIQILQKKHEQLKVIDIMKCLKKIESSGDFLKLIQTKNGQISQIDQEAIQSIKHKILNQ